MLIDVHTHLWLRAIEENKRELIQACRQYDIDRLYVSGLESLIPDQEEVRRLNREVRRFMDEQPQLIRGMVMVNPRHPDALAVLRRGIEEYGMSGLKLWMSVTCDDPLVFPLIEQCILYDVPVLIHAFHKSVGQLPNETLGAHVANLAGLYPAAKIIMAHLGGNCYNGIKPIRDCPSVYVDFSGSIFRRDDLDYTIRMIGPERILLGSDMDGSFLVCYGQVLEADLTDSQRDLIFSGNALKLFERNNQA